MKTFIFTFVTLILLCACKNEKNQTLLQIQENEKLHTWYYFDQTGFNKTSLPQKSPISSLKPWTESIRISDANTDLQDNGYLIVNRLGVIYIYNGEEPILIQDFQLFSNSTASNLIFEKNLPYLCLTRSTFFNQDSTVRKKSDNSEEDRPFLIRFSSNEKSFFPVITYKDLNLEQIGEITGTYFDGKSFFSSIKKIVNEKTSFSYIKFYSPQSLESLSPYSQKGKITISETTEENFRTKNSPLAFEDAPIRLKKLLSSIPKNFDFAVSCKSSGGFSPRIYSSKADSQLLTNSCAIICDSWTCAVFEDGTTYFNGALENRSILNDGKNIAFRLPKLPEEYKYSSFCISGKFLVAGWEETDFYKTGRSGFLLVDLEKLLYKD
ncbi:hypothetical protein [Treponema pectinovorum]|uniref:hypothetical protein n=1 Tax=Treponema pectinovorum TaxID=164 RepID=UPI0011CA8F6F|nr:hypothetical protein [Treponema pectinovorum]